ncbi:putative methyltransferase- family protein [Phaeoacremonium minimum UCRPA7]|uniref:Putative methyltransferase-family protein n=1 Tax=Phaeoacremonium minimum (strain UCR-PA7) TaxID=1286976 RepID=R8B8U2_PHAM7|nr:putative methyltransferase- family protein [Phaeoacremonium minimum UCRPA7]EON95697.1 putative methyltransferase- family protein [Phaeoacremonium minimum UCRPA7]
MAQQNLPGYYARGHSDFTIATQQRRTAEKDAGFLLPHIKKTDRILDVGCGPGTITVGLAKYASEGSTIGIDISTEVLQKAKNAAADANMPNDGPGSLIFQEGNILEGLAYPDDTFDVIFSSQVLGHFPPPEMPLRALIEMRRLLKPGGVLASRDAAASHSYPKSLELDRLYNQNQFRASRKGKPEADPTGTIMPTLYRRAGFEADGGKVRIGAGAWVVSGAETRKWLAWRIAGQLQPGDPFRQTWLDAGIPEEEIEQAVSAVKQWAETEDAWSVSVQCEMLAWK